MPQACFRCEGRGKMHDSPMPHRDGCIFCSTCAGCAGTGVVADDRDRCPRCKGAGKVHDSAMPHRPGCIFCSGCATCGGAGAIAAPVGRSAGARPAAPGVTVGAAAKAAIDATRCQACGTLPPSGASFCPACGMRQD